MYQFIFAEMWDKVINDKVINERPSSIKYTELKLCWNGAELWV